jgi:DNA repair exonuclease SbcCD ATPase subunit
MEYQNIQDPGARPVQELQLSKIARELRRDLEMEQLRDSLRKLTEDYKSLQGPGATRDMQQSNIANESKGEKLKQIKSILEQLTRDHEKLQEAVQGTSPHSKEAEKPIGPSAASRVDREAKGSRNNHMAMHVDI